MVVDACSLPVLPLVALPTQSLNVGVPQGFS